MKKEVRKVLFRDKIKEFFKPNWKKIVLALSLLIFGSFSWVGIGIGGFSISITTLKIISALLIIVAFPFFVMAYFGIYFRYSYIILLVIELFWLYLLSCALISLFRLIKNKIKWTKKKIIILSVIIAVGILVYCFFKFGFWGAIGNIFIPTADDTGATLEGVEEVVKANNQFSINLYSEINKESDENIFFSPWSISNAMVMVYEGARGDTAKEIQNVFYFPEDDATRRANFAKILNTINKAGGEYKLSTANAIWLQKNYPFLKSYQEVISKYYLSEVENLDFVGNPSGSANEINNWVSKNTNGKIKEIASPDYFNAYTRAVLTNAIYFKGKWENKFDKEHTKEEDFTLESGQKIKVPMMRLEKNDLNFNYTKSDGIQVLEMPYKGDKISMLVLLPIINDSTYWWIHEPKFSNITHLESILTEEKLQEWRNELRPKLVHIYMPKYKFETSYSLIDYLKNMGMELPFTAEGADFSGMDGTQNLFIDKVLHKAYIDVYEEGTEAVAAISIVTSQVSLPSYITFKADHPFIFIIQERETGNILFLGRVMNPVG